MSERRLRLVKRLAAQGYVKSARALVRRGEPAVVVVEVDQRRDAARDEDR